MSRGLFLAFEGIDSSGKSTQVRRLAERYDALATFEPGDSHLGQMVRAQLLDPNEHFSPEVEAFLMLADRSHHVREVIEPTLATGRSVITDRFAASTLAYQGFGRRLDLARLMAATELAVGECRADLTILLDLPLAAAVERRATRHDDRFERADAEFHERVRDGFLELAAAAETEWFVVDASQDLATVSAVIDERVAQLPWPRG